MDNPSYYVLVRNHTEGMALYSCLRDERLNVRISPVPRGLTACCGMSLLVHADSIDEVRNIITTKHMEIDKIVALENQINPHRDKYC